MLKSVSIKAKYLSVMALIALPLCACSKKAIKTTTNNSTNNTTNKQTTTKQKIEYTVKFDMKGGTGTINDQKVKEGEKIVKPVDPKKEGYSVEGWYYKDKKWSFTDDVVNDNITLEAKWTINSYTLTLNVDSKQGSVTGANTYEYNSEVTISATPTENHYFDGWYKDGEKTDYTQEATFTMPGSDLTLEARFFDDFIYDENDSTRVIGARDKTKTNLVVPSSVTSIANGAFSGCSNLVSITLPFVGDMAHESTDDYQYPFGYIFGGESYEGSNASYQQYYESSTNSSRSAAYFIPQALKEVIITGSSYLQRGAFDSCYYLEKIIISDSVLSIEQYAFSGCSSLKSVSLGAGVTSIGKNAFYNCEYLLDVTLGNSITNVGKDAFTYCNRIDNVYLNGTVGDWCNISFVDNFSSPIKSGTNLYLLDSNGNVEHNGNKYSLLTNVVIPDTVTKIGNSLFAHNCGITSVTIPDSVLSIGSNAFDSCLKLENVTLGNNITSIGNFAFITCNKLKSIKIPKSVTSIGNSVFHDCPNLAHISVDSENTVYDSRDNCEAIIRTADNTLIYGCMYSSVPDSVTKIAGSAFYRCINKTSMIIGSGLKTVESGAFLNCNNLSKIF